MEGESRRYKNLAEGAMTQVADAALADAAGSDNSIATIVWHISGNLQSRFTDFLTSDGEKPWRDRDSEFLARRVTRSELLAKWEEGWRGPFAGPPRPPGAGLQAVGASPAPPPTRRPALPPSLAHPG